MPPIQNSVKHLRWIFLRKSLMGSKVNSKPCQTSEMELLLKVITGCRGEFRILAKYLRWSFLQKQLKTKSRLPFTQKPPSWMFDRVIFEPYLRSQTLINIHEIFHNISHVDLIYVLRSGVESFSHTLHLPYFSYGTYGNVLCHHNRHLMAHFEFLHYSEVICLPLNIIEKLY